MDFVELKNCFFQNSLFHTTCERRSDLCCNTCSRGSCAVHGRFCRECDAWVCVECTDDAAKVCYHCLRSRPHYRLKWFRRLEKMYKNRLLRPGDIAVVAEFVESIASSNDNANYIRQDAARLSLRHYMSCGAVVDFKEMKLHSSSFGGLSQFIGKHAPPVCYLFQTEERKQHYLKLMTDMAMSIPVFFQDLLIFCDYPMKVIRAMEPFFRREEAKLKFLVRKAFFREEGGNVLKCLKRADLLSAECLEDFLSQQNSLHMAKNAEAIHLMLNAGMDTEARDALKMTPLTQHLTHGDIEVSKLLLEKGANIAVAKRDVPSLEVNHDKKELVMKIFEENRVKIGEY